MKKNRKRLLTWLIVLISVAAFLLSPHFAFARSALVMSVYSKICEKESLLSDGVSVKIPGGWTTPERDWFPLMMCFTADSGFSASWGYYANSSVKLRLTILYDFGAFGGDRRSAFYDTESPYYNSFYGAYLVQRSDGGHYGFRADGSLNTVEIAAVPRYDYFRLVLEDFGLEREDEVFDWKVTYIEPMDGEWDGWTRMTADLTVNGPAHAYAGFVQSYLQYGNAPKTCEHPFEPVEMKGVIYAKYFEEQNESVFLYAVCADEAALERCEEQLLRKAVVE